MGAEKPHLKLNEPLTEVVQAEVWLGLVGWHPDRQVILHGGRTNMALSYLSRMDWRAVKEAGIRMSFTEEQLQILSQELNKIRPPVPEEKVKKLYDLIQKILDLHRANNLGDPLSQLVVQEVIRRLE